MFHSQVSLSANSVRLVGFLVSVLQNPVGSIQFRRFTAHRIDVDGTERRETALGIDPGGISGSVSKPISRIRLA